MESETSVSEMAMSSTVRGVPRPINESETHRPDYVSHKRVRASRSIPSSSIRLIYFDERLAADLLEHLASAPVGRTMLAHLAMRARIEEANLFDTLQQHDQRAILSQIIDNATDLEVGGVIDLHQPEGQSRRTAWPRLHPDQVIAVRGIVISPKDIQPSSLRLQAEATFVRAYVERDHFLHLNQKYLTGLPVTIVGKVRSVPRIEMRAATIGVLVMPDEPQKEMFAVIDSPPQ